MKTAKRRDKNLVHEQHQYSFFLWNNCFHILVFIADMTYSICNFNDFWQWPKISKTRSEIVFCICFPLQKGFLFLADKNNVLHLFMRQSLSNFLKLSFEAMRISVCPELSNYFFFQDHWTHSFLELPRCAWSTRNADASRRFYCKQFAHASFERKSRCSHVSFERKSRCTHTSSTRVSLDNRSIIRMHDDYTRKIEGRWHGDRSGIEEENRDDSLRDTGTYVRIWPIEREVKRVYNWGMIS